MCGVFIYNFFYFKQITSRVEGSRAVLALMGFETSKGGTTPVTAVLALKLELFAFCSAVYLCLCDYSGEGGVEAYWEGH